MGANIRTLEGVKKLEALQSLSNEYRRLKDRIIRDDFYVPLHFYPRGSEGLKGISYKSSVASAQVKSAVLLASFYARGELTYREPYVSRNHMEQLLLDSGIKLTQRGSHLRLTCGQKLKMKERIAIPGDFSFAALYILAATLIPRSQIVIKGVGINRTRTGFLETLREMGASIEKMNERKMGREPVADLLISYRKLQGVKIPKERIPSMIDEIPLLTIAASQAASDTIIEGVNELKYKESDRQLGIIGLLQSFGGSAKIKNHTLYISGNKPLRGGSVSTFGDHRLGFAAIAAAVVSNRETLLRNTSSLKLSIETPDQLEPLLQ